MEMTSRMGMEEDM